MKSKFSKLVVVTFSIFSMLTLVGPASAENHQEEYKAKYIDLEAYEKSTGSRSLAIAFDQILKNVLTGPAPFENTITSVLGTCNAAMKSPDVGYEISSILVTPTGAGGGGANARSMSPDQILSNSCQIDSNNIEVCIVVVLPDE